MVRWLVYNKLLKWFLKAFFSIIYNKEYLRGECFDVKRMGWFWALRSIPDKLVGNNRNIPWPVNPQTIVSNSKNIEFDVDDIYIFQVPGCYWQNHDAKIKVGKGVYIAPNVGIITTNHDAYDLSKHIKGRDIVIGPSCWVGMNSVILPGVALGPHTIVGAGAVVSHSFPEGYCIICGNPAKKIRDLDKKMF